MKPALVLNIYEFWTNFIVVLLGHYQLLFVPSLNSNVNRCLMILPVLAWLTISHNMNTHVPLQVPSRATPAGNNHLLNLCRLWGICQALSELSPRQRQSPFPINVFVFLPARLAILFCLLPAALLQVWHRHTYAICSGTACCSVWHRLTTCHRVSSGCCQFVSFFGISLAAFLWFYDSSKYIWLPLFSFHFFCCFSSMYRLKKTGWQVTWTPQWTLVYVQVAIFAALSND